MMKQNAEEENQSQQQHHQSTLQTRDDESKKDLGPLGPEETQLLRKLYEPTMEEGLDKFDNALSKNMHEFNVSIA